jgi:hypothetical protein
MCFNACRAPPGMDAVPAVMPKEYEEFVTYLEGRRSLHKLSARKMPVEVKTEMISDIVDEE